MKYSLFVILTLAASFRSIGQEIEAIVLATWQMDEPPTIPGPASYSISFQKNDRGELITAYYYKNTDRVRLKDSITIEKDRIRTAESWTAVNKNVFTLTDLGIDIITLRSRIGTCKLNFEIPDDLTVRIDSFQYCQQYKMVKSISTGGQAILVTLFYTSGQKDEFVFNSTDMGMGAFNLKNYLLCYMLLKDRIPTEVHSNDFFSRDKLSDVLLCYQSTVECEGYYYKEYADKSGMSGRERRMMTGWDFVKYMGGRIRK